VKEYQKHIKNTHADHVGEAICGVKLQPFDWAFMDVDHAFHSNRYGSRLQPCPACNKVVIDAFATTTDQS
jgi:hypothetical protein